MRQNHNYEYVTKYLVPNTYVLTDPYAIISNPCPSSKLIYTYPKTNIAINVIDIVGFDPSNTAFQISS